MNRWNSQTANKNDTKPIEILGRSIAVLHKVLKKEDQFKAMYKQKKYGEPVNIVPSIAIDFTTVTSIQEDYKNKGTIIIKKKMAVAVKEPLADVLKVWIEIKNRMAKWRSSGMAEMGSLAIAVNDVEA